MDSLDDHVVGLDRADVVSCGGGLNAPSSDCCPRVHQR
jgi:hypothetical protein